MALPNIVINGLVTESHGQRDLRPHSNDHGTATYPQLRTSTVIAIWKSCLVQGPTTMMEAYFLTRATPWPAIPTWPIWTTMIAPRFL